MRPAAAARVALPIGTGPLIHSAIRRRLAENTGSGVSSPGSNSPIRNASPADSRGYAARTDATARARATHSFCISAAPSCSSDGFQGFRSQVIGEREQKLSVRFRCDQRRKQPDDPGVAKSRRAPRSKTAIPVLLESVLLAKAEHRQDPVLRKVQSRGLSRGHSGLRAAPRGGSRRRAIRAPRTVPEHSRTWNCGQCACACSLAWAPELMTSYTHPARIRFGRTGSPHLREGRTGLNIPYAGPFDFQ